MKQTIKEKVLNEMNVNVINPRYDFVDETVYTSRVVDLTIRHVLKLINKISCSRGHFDGKKIVEDLIDRKELKEKIKENDKR